MATGKPPKYEPLRRYLAGLPHDVTETTLTFAAIEAILGAPLPASAWQQHWWVNVRHSSQGRAWLAAGWRLAGRNFHPAGSAVTFTRAASTPSPSAPSRRRMPLSAA